jgi:hypothetical protein
LHGLSCRNDQTEENSTGKSKEHKFDEISFENENP